MKWCTKPYWPYRKSAPHCTKHMSQQDQKPQYTALRALRCHASIACHFCLGSIWIHLKTYSRQTYFVTYVLCDICTFLLCETCQFADQPTVEPQETSVTQYKIANKQFFLFKIDKCKLNEKLFFFGEQYFISKTKALFF